MRLTLEPRTKAGRTLLSWRGQHATWTEERWVEAIRAIEEEAAGATIETHVPRSTEPRRSTDKWPGFKSNTGGSPGDRRRQG